MRQRLALALVLVAVLLTLMLLWGVKDERLFRLEAPAPEEKLSARVSPTSVTTETVTEKPQFNGEDAKGRKWQINAENATQNGSVSNSVVGLQQAQGWWQNGSTTLVGRAREADYAPNDGKLALRGDVEMKTSDTVIQTPAAKADMTTHEISGTSGVSLTHTLSNQTLKVQAQNFVVDPETKKVTLTGKVHARLEPK